jgi:hypothetical protein
VWALVACALLLAAEPLFASGCIGSSYILVKTSWDGSIFIATDTCDKNHSKKMDSLGFTLIEWNPEPAVTIWAGSGDPNTHTTNPLSVGNAPVDYDPPGDEWPYHFGTASLKDIGTYVYKMSGTYCCEQDNNGQWVENDLRNDSMEWTVDNSPPEASIDLDGTLKVGNTISFDANAHDADENDTTGMHFEWSVAARPSGSNATFDNATAESPLMEIADKHDIGDWTIRLDVADAQGELKTFTHDFTVVNQPPVLEITGDIDIDALTDIQLEAGPDTDDDGEDVTFEWDLVQSPANAPEQPQSNFSTDAMITIPTGPTGIGTWKFHCVATDEHGATDSADVNVNVTAVPPKIELDPQSPVTIPEGGTIDFTDTILDDAYGDPIVSFEWEVLQAPIGAASLGSFDSGPSIQVPNAEPGTWIFKLTVTDQVGETADKTAQVLVDSQPVAAIDDGVPVVQNLTTPVTLSGTDSTDADSPNTPPDYGHVHVDAPDVSLPEIAHYRWYVVMFPPEDFGTFFQGPVGDVLGISDTGATLNIPPGTLTVGDWTFELEVTDAEGNKAYADHSLTVINPDIAPFAILPGPQYFPATAQGVLLSDVGVDGSQSFDLDNLLNQSGGAGLGITSYEWYVLGSPPLCGIVPQALSSGPSASFVILYNANTQVPPECQGMYEIGLAVTDDDTPVPHVGVNATTVLIGNCQAVICIDGPTEASPKFVKFSNQAEVVIQYHLDSTLYDDPALTNGLRVRLEIFHENDPLAVFNEAYDVDLLPAQKGGPLAIHWYGFVDNATRPEPGLYTIRLSLLDRADNPTAYSATEVNSIQIQRLDIAVEGSSDEWLNANELESGGDELAIDYSVSGLFPGEPDPYDELRYTIYESGTDAIVAQDSDFGPFNDTFLWDGSVVPGIFIDPGTYDIVLEILEGGAKLGESERHTFRVYRTNIELAGVADADELDPGALVEEGTTIDVTVSIDGPVADLPGDAVFKTDDHPGTLTAKDGPTAVDIDAGVNTAASSLGSPKTYTITAAAPGDAKTLLSLAYQPPGTGLAKKATAQAAITVIRSQLRAPSSDVATQESDGVFVAGAAAPVVVTPANFGQLKFRMRPVDVLVQPDMPSSSVELAFVSGNAANVELYDAALPNAQLTLPKTWAPADFFSHKLDLHLLAYGKSFGDVVLRLTYKKGATTLHEEKLKLRVGPRPGMTGVTLPEFPFFRTVRTANLGAPIVVALDPFVHRERVARAADVYIVDHKTPAEWAADPSLIDATGGPQQIIINPTSIASNEIALPAPSIAGDFDVVFDFGNFADDPLSFIGDATLDPGDLLDDSLSGAPSVGVRGSLTAAGPLATTTFDYDFANAVPIGAGYDGLVNPFNFRLRGRLVYPATFSGPAPLVVIGHGRHTPLNVLNGFGVFQNVDPDRTSDENYRGHTYLQEHLASRGFVTMSVDFDEVFAVPGSGYPTINGVANRLRGWLLLKNIEKILTDPAVAGGALNGHIDTTRIYLVGHSRGGEAVVVANHIIAGNTDKPPGGTIGGFTAAGIRGIVSLSATSLNIETMPITKPAVPYLLLYGSADGDVNGAMAGVEPFRHYDRALADKYAVRIEGANHNFFNTSWGISDATQKLTGPDEFTLTPSPLVPPVGGPLLSDTQQRDVAKAYVAAFLLMLEGDTAMEGYFLEPPARLIPLGVDPAVSLHAQARHAPSAQQFVLDDFESNGSATLSSSGQAVTTTIGAASLSELTLTDTSVIDPASTESEPANRFFQETSGALFDYNAAQELVESVAPAQQDLRGANVLSFRIAQQPKHAETIALAGPLTLTVELEDAASNKSAIRLATLDSAEAIYVAQVFVPQLAALFETTSAAFKTFRIPITAFTTDGRTLDLAHVTKIRFKLAAPGDSARGRIALDDLEVEK